MNLRGVVGVLALGVMVWGTACSTKAKQEEQPTLAPQPSSVVDETASYEAPAPVVEKKKSKSKKRSSRRVTK